MPFSFAWGSTGAFAEDRHAAKPAGAAAAAGRRDADAGAVQHAEQAVAASGFDRLAPVHRDQDRFLRNQTATRNQQADRHADNQNNDDATADRDFDHATTICAKAEKPSDIIPASTKVIPRPLRPPGRSA